FMTVREPLARFCSELVMRCSTLDEPWSPDAEKFADRTMRRLPGNGYLHDNHLRPQHEFYVPGATVFRLEDGLHRAASVLRDDFGLELEQNIPHNAARQGSMPGSAVDLPEKCRAKLLEQYRQDFLQFGYDLPEP